LAAKDARAEVKDIGDKKELNSLQERGGILGKKGKHDEQRSMGQKKQMCGLLKKKKPSKRK